MSPEFSPGRRRALLVLAGVLAPEVCGGEPLPGSLLAAATAPEPASPSQIADVALAPRSTLPYPLRAELWVDAEGAPTVTPPGVPIGAILRVRVVVFRPERDRLEQDTLVRLLVAAGRLAPNASPRLVAEPDRRSLAAVNRESTQVYAGKLPNEMVVLGQVQNTATQHLLAYAVVVSGTLNAAQALVQARAVVAELAERARLTRLAVPRPSGSVPVSPTWRLEGARLRELARSIEQDVTLSPSVRSIARVLLPQSAAVEYSAWRTREPLTDQAFFDFYSQHTLRQGWGSPISRDATQPGRPSLLYQRPADGAVVLIRASTPAPIAALPRAGTTLTVLVMEGRINLQGLSLR